MSEDLNVHIIDHPLIQHKLTRSLPFFNSGS